MEEENKINNDNEVGDAGIDICLLCCCGEEDDVIGTTIKQTDIESINADEENNVDIGDEDDDLIIDVSSDDEADHEANEIDGTEEGLKQMRL